MLLADYGKHTLLPEDKFADFKRPEPFIPASRGHHAEWVHACKTGEPTTCNFEYASKLSEGVLLGTVAYRVGREIDWDPATATSSVAEVEALVHKPHRQGFEV